jgi:hypothetical protein
MPSSEGQVWAVVALARQPITVSARAPRRREEVEFMVVRPWCSKITGRGNREEP